MRLQIFSTVLLVLLLSVSIIAQAMPGNLQDNPAESREAAKFDEFGDIAESEFAPKIRRFASMIEKNENLQGFVIYYGSLSDPLFRQTNYYFNRRRNKVDEYLADCCSSNRITFQFGGLRDEKRYELWSVPAGGVAPKPSNLQRELLYRFELLESDELKFESKITESSDGEESWIDYELSNKVDLEDLLSVAGQVLSKDENRRSVLIYYLDESVSNIEKSRQAFEQFVADKAEKNELELSRVKIVFGGYRRQSEVESWVIPIDEVEPEVMPEERANCIVEN